MPDPSITIRPDPSSGKAHILINGRHKDLSRIKEIIKRYIDPRIKKEIQELKMESDNDEWLF